MDDDRLERLRRRIRNLDAALLGLVAERMELAREVGRAKRERGVPLRDYEVEKRVLARAPSEVHARILRMIGAEEVILPEESAADDLARRLVQPSLKSFFELIEGFSVAEIEAPANFHGKKLVELDLKNRFRINLVAITRPLAEGKDRINAVPLGTDVIQKGDILAVAGRDEDIKGILEGRLG